MGLVAAMLLVIAFLILLQRGRLAETTPMSSPRPRRRQWRRRRRCSAVRFMDIPWGTSRGGPHEARGHGLTSIERDEDGDDRIRAASTAATPASPRCSPASRW
jgi:hypothetical protein